MQKAIYKKNQDGKRVAVYEFSLGLRLAHWIRAISIVILVFTGFYISYVFQYPVEKTLVQNLYRFAHEIFGFIFIACILFKIYLFFTDKTSKIERASVKDLSNKQIWLEQIKFYLCIGNHPHLKGAYNPIQFVTYFVLYVVFVGLILTGLILYMHNYHNGLGGLLMTFLSPVEYMFGGLAEVRVWHKLFTWFVIIFVPIHIYIVVLNSIKNKDGSTDAIVSGYKYEDESIHS